MITPVQMTQGPCNHCLMLQQSFQLFTTEDSRATLQPGSEPETTGADGRRQSVLFSLGLPAREYFQGIHLYLRELEYSHFAWEAVRVEMKSAFPSCMNLQRNGNNKGVYICNTR